MKIQSVILRNAFNIMLMIVVSCSSPNEKKTGNDSSIEKEDKAKEETAVSSYRNENTSSLRINNQVWMPTNLNTQTFRNGDAIFEAKTAQDWKEKTEAGLPACCFANFNPDNGKIYGRLYNWFAVNDSRSICPKGWRVPSDNDFKNLRLFLGDQDGDKLKSDKDEFWNESDREFINMVGFNGLPGGAATFEGIFVQVGASGFWWSSTESNEDAKNTKAFYMGLMDNQPDALRKSYDKQLGFSVRCIKE